MRLASLIVKEIGYRKVNFALSLGAVLVAVALFVTFVTAGEAYRKETRKIQLGMGQNLRIIPKQTPMDKFWSMGFSKHMMPEEYVHRFASLENYEYMLDVFHEFCPKHQRPASPKLARSRGLKR